MLTLLLPCYRYVFCLPPSPSHYIPQTFPSHIPALLHNQQSLPLPRILFVVMMLIGKDLPVIFFTFCSICLQISFSFTPLAFPHFFFTLVYPLAYYHLRKLHFTQLYAQTISLACLKVSTENEPLGHFLCFRGYVIKIKKWVHFAQLVFLKECQKAENEAINKTFSHLYPCMLLRLKLSFSSSLSFYQKIVNVLTVFRNLHIRVRI